MTSRETLKASSNASADARLNTLQRTAKETVAKIEAMKAAPEQIAAQIRPLAESMAELSEQVRGSLQALQDTTATLPQTYANKVKEVTARAEKSITSLYRTTVEVRDQALSVANYAKAIDKRQRRNMWTVAITVGILSGVPSTVLCLAIAQATGNPPVRLVKALLGL